MIRADQKQTHHQPGKKEGSTDDRGREQSSTRVAVAPAIRSESESHGHAPWSPSSACGLPFSGRLRSSLSLWLSPSPMARPRKPPPPSPPKAAAPSIADALLLATVCMVGLPVEVRVRDGSAYAGVLHTACVDAGYGERSDLSLSPHFRRVSLGPPPPCRVGDHGKAVLEVIRQLALGSRWTGGCDRLEPAGC
jgi:hypothetical protein